jgi:hypothetical protein
LSLARQTKLHGDGSAGVKVKFSLLMDLREPRSVLLLSLSLSVCRFSKRAQVGRLTRETLKEAQAGLSVDK